MAKSKKNAVVTVKAEDVAGLRAPQARVLQALSESNTPLNRASIAEIGDVDVAMLNSYIGSHKEDIRKKNDANVCVSLLTLGYVEFAAAEEGQRGHHYTITSAGRKAL